MVSFAFILCVKDLVFEATDMEVVTSFHRLFGDGAPTIEEGKKMKVYTLTIEIRELCF